MMAPWQPRCALRGWLTGCIGAPHRDWHSKYYLVRFHDRDVHWQAASASALLSSSKYYLAGLLLLRGPAPAG